MASTLQRSIVWLGVGLIIVPALGLSGCAGSYSAEETAAQTATVAAMMVPTATPSPQVTSPPTQEVTLPPTREPAPFSTASPPADSEPVAQDLSIGTEPGQLPPDFSLVDAAGQQIRLRDLKGQPTVVIFWASWCSHCQKEMPLLQAMYEEYSDQGLAVVGVNVPGLGGETKGAALAFMADKDITFPVVFDEQGSAYSDYQIRGVPNLFFIDRDGVLVLNQPGAMERDRLEQHIKRIVEEG